MRALRFVVTCRDRRARHTAVLEAARTTATVTRSSYPADPSRPWARPDVVARARVRVSDTELTLRAPVVFRYEGPFVGGEKRHALQVVPAYEVRVSPDLRSCRGGACERAAARSSCAPSLGATLRAPARRELRLELPAGWSVRPADRAAALRVRGRGGRRRASS